MKHKKQNKAFTLAEVILAIAIMGVGMVFAACLFPAAIKETESSSAALEGLIIAQNGLNVAKEMLHGNIATPPLASNISINTPNKQISGTGNFIWIDGEVTKENLSNSALGLSGFYDPTADWSTPPSSLPDTGCVILIQRQGSTNDYLVISVSYRKRKSTSTILVESLPFNLGSMKETVQNVANPDKFVKNGMVIVNTNTDTAGKMARITGKKKNGSNYDVTIEHPLTNGGTINNVIVINEIDAGNVLQQTPVLSATSAIITIN